ncbi:MAG: PLP-dependent aminotransferase family protein [Verrucomicrobia bacterium]|nr:PLP-dependent aminotransferase family protein [Verrucomicrobiota bacterium]
MKLTLSQPGMASLAAGFTDNLSLPVEAVREIVESVLARPRLGRAALQYGSTAGDESLRDLTSQHLRASDMEASGKPQPSSLYSPDRLLITHGSQQLLYLCTEALCDEGDWVLVEDPTYFVYLGILRSRGVRARGVRMRADGLDLAHLEEVLESMKASGELRRLKMIYSVTYFQNPSSITTCFAKKKAALALLKRYESAAGHPLYYLEDAAYRELRFAGDDVSSALVAPRGASRVLYAGTYSKPFASGARVGFGLLPEPVFTAVLRIKGNHDFGTSNFLQQLLAEALARGHFRKHLPRLRARYASKRAVMTQAIRERFPSGVRWEDPQGGLYVWATLPSRCPTGFQSRFFKQALAAKVLYVPGDLCYASDRSRRPSRSSMRLSFGGSEESGIRTGIERLGRLMEKHKL